MYIIVCVCDFRPFKKHGPGRVGFPLLSTPFDDPGATLSPRGAFWVKIASAGIKPKPVRTDIVVKGNSRERFGC